MAPIYIEYLEREYEQKWWESDDLVEFIWGQLNTAYLAVDPDFFKQSVNALLLGDPALEHSSENAAVLRVKMQDRYQELYDWDAIAKKKL